MEILNMLKNGTINAEEAERLLSALDEGEKSSSRTKQSRGRRYPDHLRNEFRPLKEFGKVFSGFGKAFGGTMKSAFGGTEFTGLRDLDDFEDVDFDHGEYLLPDGANLTVRQPNSPSNGGGDVRLVQTESKALRVDTDGDVRLKRRGAEYAFIVADDCPVHIPASCALVSVALFNGDVSAEDISIPTTVNTMNGDVRLLNVIILNSCTTMSGDISARVTDIDGSRIDITTMSGDIDLGIPSGFRGIVEASTMSGDVDFDLPEATIDDKSGFVGRNVHAQVGDDPFGPVLHCTTMSGDVRVEIALNSDVSHAHAE